MMRTIKFSLFYALFFIFLITLGSSPLQAVNNVSSDLGSNDIKRRLAFGNTNSPLEIYVVSDWFCPSCHKMEPRLQQLYPEFQSKAAFYFVDHPIHRKSSNFIPYHLALLINDKKNYFDIRKALLDLTEHTNDPTDQDIEDVLKQNGVKFKELDFSDVKSGTEFFEDTVQLYNINATPTVVILDKRTGKVEKLRGSDINEQNLNEKIRNVQNPEIRQSQPQSKPKPKQKEKGKGWLDFLWGK